MTNASARERSVNFAERVVQRLVFGGRRTFPGLEPVYQRIFEREIGRLGIAGCELDQPEASFRPLGHVGEAELFADRRRIGK